MVERPVAHRAATGTLVPAVAEAPLDAEVATAAAQVATITSSSASTAPVATTSTPPCGSGTGLPLLSATRTRVQLSTENAKDGALELLFGQGAPCRSRRGP